MCGPTEGPTCKSCRRWAKALKKRSKTKAADAAAGQMARLRAELAGVKQARSDVRAQTEAALGTGGGGGGGGGGGADELGPPPPPPPMGGLLVRQLSSTSAAAAGPDLFAKVAPADVQRARHLLALAAAWEDEGGAEARRALHEAVRAGDLDSVARAVRRRNAGATWEEACWDAAASEAAAALPPKPKATGAAAEEGPRWAGGAVVPPSVIGKASGPASGWVALGDVPSAAALELVAGPRVTARRTGYALEPGEAFGCSRELLDAAGNLWLKVAPVANDDDDEEGAKDEDEGVGSGFVKIRGGDDYEDDGKVWVPHSGEWRGSLKKQWCSLGSSRDGPVCFHPPDTATGGVIPANHWSCCGVRDQRSPCTEPEAVVQAFSAAEYAATRAKGPTSAAGAAVSGGAAAPAGVKECPACTFHNPPSRTKCEICNGKLPAAPSPVPAPAPGAATARAAARGPAPSISPSRRQSSKALGPPQTLATRVSVSASGCSNGGMMFNVEARPKSSVTITSVTTGHRATASTFEIWVMDGDCTETAKTCLSGGIPAGWRRVYSGSVTSVNSSGHTYALSPAVVVPAGKMCGMYLFANNGSGLRFESVPSGRQTSSGNHTAENTDLIIRRVRSPQSNVS